MVRKFITGAAVLNHYKDGALIANCNGKKDYENETVPLFWQGTG